MAKNTNWSYSNSYIRPCNCWLHFKYGIFRFKNDANYKINNTISIRPLVETTYRHYTTPSYSESGSGASLSVDKFTSTQFILGGGAIVDYKLGSESKLVSEFHLGYDFHHDANSVTASFAEAPSIKFDTVVLSMVAGNIM